MQNLDQLPLFLEELEPRHKERKLGSIEITPIHSKTILTKGTGFISEVDYSINPYRGCSHACTFCYAAAFSPTPEKKESWGGWVNPKINAPGLTRRLPPAFLFQKRVILSSVTDPYQPIEKQYKITQQILEILVKHQPQLIIQTHGCLVTRDIPLLQQFQTKSVNISITTDCENIRKEFEPKTPTIASRLEAVETLEKAGISTRVTICPMLPIKNPKIFGKLLKSTGCTQFAAQYFHGILGDYRSSTKESVLPLLQKHQWSNQKYLECSQILAQELAPYPLFLGDNSLEYDKLTKAEPIPILHLHKPPQKDPLPPEYTH